MVTLRLLTVFAALLAGFAATPNPVGIVAAENFYGDIAGQVAGPEMPVTSILINPDQDPHLFEASPSVARLVADAAIVIQNGADYDPWMTRLLANARSPHRQVIVVADLVHRSAGANPHLWYDPPTMPALASALAAALSSRDPTHARDYGERLRSVLASLQALSASVDALRAQFSGTPVTATEPVFGYMAAALGLKMRNERFQFAIMNGTEPRASDVAAFDNDLRGHAVHLLLYNSQTSAASTRRLIRIAQESQIPVVGVTETQPPGKTYQQWMLDELDAVAQALRHVPS
jgi:zinc/manganese transport system substrate-binding protein